MSVACLRSFQPKLSDSIKYPVAMTFGVFTSPRKVWSVQDRSHARRLRSDANLTPSGFVFLTAPSVPTKSKS